MTRKFYAIGHGGFYSEDFKYFDLKGNENHINFVYDCGSRSRRVLKSAIDEFKKSTKEIDLLCISHFDFDHINGIQKLSSDITFKNIVIPYLYGENKYFYLAKAFWEMEEITTDIIHLIMDPKYYFREQIKSDANIYFICSKEQQQETNQDKGEIIIEENHKKTYKILTSSLIKSEKLDTWMWKPFNYNHKRCCGNIKIEIEKLLSFKKIDMLCNMKYKGELYKFLLKEDNLTKIYKNEKSKYYTEPYERAATEELKYYIYKYWSMEKRIKILQLASENPECDLNKLIEKATSCKP